MSERVVAQSFYNAKSKARCPNFEDGYENSFISFYTRVYYLS